jgi:long-chain acyl-CoA synthetase
LAHIWEKSYPEGIRWDIDLDVRPVTRLIDEAVAEYGDKYLIDFLDRRFTYREIGEMIDKAAAGFRKLGVKKGVQVGLFLPNTPHYVIAFFGILKAGGTVVNFSPLYAPREVLQQIKDSETKVMVTLNLNALYPKIAEVLPESGLEKVVVGTLSEMLPFPKNLLYPLLKSKDIARTPKDDRHMSFKELLDNDGKYDEADRGDPFEDVILLQYTGGTTGLPKGAMLTSGSVMSAMAIFREWLKQMEGQRTDHDKTLLVLPLFHIYGLSAVMLVNIAEGSELILHPSPDVDRVIEDIGKKKPTTLPGVPTLFTAILNHPKAKETDFSSLVYCGSGGAPLPQEVQAKFQELSGVRLAEGYGLTETSPVGTANMLAGTYKTGSCGLPLPRTRIEIRDLEDDSKVLPTGEVGEVCIVGPVLMKGYWQRPEETAKALRSGPENETRLHTGDTGYLDEDGFLFLVDRTKDMILCSGYNVYPRVIEEAIYEHPAVEEVTVIGIPDEYRGEAPKAFVKLKAGATAPTLQEMKEFLSSRIGKHEMIAEIEVRDELPKTPVGKLSKKELREEEMARRKSAAA